MADFDMQDQISGSVAARDPDLTQTVQVARPTVAPLIDVPPEHDRYTVYVPSEKTTLSLGQKSAKKAHHIDDVGITGRTDNHVHLHVQDKNKTAVSLGGPATSVQIEAHDAKVPKESVGYSMVTDENAWHDAQKQHYLVSRTKDIVVRTVGPAGDATALVQSDKGTVTVAAGQAVTLGGKGNVKIVSHTAAPIEEAPKYEVKVERKVTTDFDERYKSSGKATVDHLKAVHDALTDAVKTQKKKPTWHKSQALQDVSAAEVQPVLDTLQQLHAALTALLKPETLGSIDLVAERHVSVGADHVAVHGVSGVDIGSAQTAALTGDTTAVGAKTNLALWSGSHTSLKSGTDVSVEAETGELTAQASKDVVIASETKGVIVQGQTDAQLNGKDGSAYVHGATSAYVGAGSGSGHAMIATEKSAFVGVVSQAAEFAFPGADPSHGLSVGSSATQLVHSPSMVKLTDSELQINSSAVTIGSSQDVTVNGQRILLG
jgi:hypothetical protein